MNYKKKKYGLLIIVMLLFISVGYALINTTLKMNGSSKIKHAKWDIYFDNITNESGVRSSETKIDDKKTTVSFDIDLKKPGDFYEFNVDTVNDGTLDAIIDSTELTGLSNNTKEIIDYTVTYNDGTSVNKCDTLNVGDRKKLLVKVKYFDNVKEEDLLVNNENLKLKFKINYVQTGICDRNPILEIDPNGGKYNNSRKITKRNVEKNSSLTIGEAEKEGYNFLNWKTSDGTDLEKDPDTKLTTINVGTSDIKIIAQWQKKVDPALIKYTITINPNGGLYNNSTDVITYEKKKGEIVEVNGTIERDGYLFKGWDVDPSNSSFVNNVLTVGTEDATLTAKWELDLEHVVAKIDSKYFTTLQKAFDAAKTNDKIELLKDITETSTNTKEVNLDLGTHTINGTINNTGILTVDNGKIQNLTEGQAPIVNTGTIIIGTNNERVIQDSIILYGKTTGLIQNGQFYFYDGYIEGDIAFKGGYNGSAAGYIVYVDHDNVLNCQKAYLTETSPDAVVKVKSYTGTQSGPQLYIYFKSLGDGIRTTTNDNPDVYALKSFPDSENIIVAEGQILNINLEGFTIREGAQIINNGTLTIKDTVQGRGTFKTETYPIVNNETFNLSNSNIIQTASSKNTIENHGTLNFSNSTIQSNNGYALYNKTTNNLVFSNDTYFTSTGGYSFYNDSTEEIELTGGSFQGIHNKGTKLTINSATITNSAGNYGIYNEKGIITLKNSNVTSNNNTAINNEDTLNIESGTYNAENSNVISNYTTSNVVNISGGNISSNGQYTISNGKVTISGNNTIISNTSTSSSSAAIYAYGTVNINGGSIISASRAIYARSATININGGTITNTSSSEPAVYLHKQSSYEDIDFNMINGEIISENNTAINTNSDNCIITGGLIKGKIYGIYNIGKIVIGNDDDIVDPDLPERKPIIMGDTYGMYISSGKVMFYDGIIKGKNDDVYYGTITETSDGTIINKSQEQIDGETYNTAYLYKQDNFLKVGTKEFNSLKKAIKYITDNGNSGTIIVIKDGVSSSSSTIPNSDNIILNLNGNKITVTSTIVNNGTLKIVNNNIDNETEKKGSLESNNTVIINNNNKLTIDDGKFTNLSNYIIEQDNSNATLTINGGVFTGDSAYCLMINGKLDIEGGEFSSNNDAIYIHSYETMLIKNASIKSTNSTAINSYSATLNIDNITVTDSKNGISNSCSGTTNISNSTINVTNTGIEGSYGGCGSGGAKGTITNTDIYSNNIAITTNGNYTLNGGNIYGKNRGISNSGTFKMNSGNVSSDEYGVYVNRANFTIIDGKIESKKIGIYNYAETYSTSIVNIGNNKDESIALITTPIIIGDTFGIKGNHNNSYLNFYDGIIKSKETQINTITINTTPDGYITANGIDSTNPNYKTTYLTAQTPFLQVGNTTYSSLQKAIDAAGENGTITLISNGLVTNNASIDSDQNITFDLNGNTLRTTKTITNNGVFTIKDNTNEKNGLLINNDNTLDLIINKATLNIESGNIESKGKVIINDNNSNLNISGGNIKFLGTNYAIENKGDTIITGGTIDFTYEYVQALIESRYGNLEITGGILGNKNLRVNELINMSYSSKTLKIGGTDEIYAGDGNVLSISNGTNFIMTGGYLNSKQSRTIYSSNAKVNISGGKIKSDSSYGIYLTGSSYTTSITGGEIIGKTYGVYLDNGKLNLGNNNNEIVNIPVLKGDTYGLYINSGTVNFYDGILKGKNTNVYYGNISSTSDNTIIGSGEEIDSETGETYYTKFLMSQVEFVQNKRTLKNYSNFQEAINEANSGDELELFDNANLYYPITIPDKTLKISLNSHNIITTNPIINNAKLTIVDENTTSEKGKISTTGSFKMITNNNEITLKNIKLQNYNENEYIINNTNSSKTTLNNVEINTKKGISNGINSNLKIVDSSIITEDYSIYNNGGIIDIEGSNINTSDIYNSAIYSYSSSSNRGNITIRNTTINSNTYSISAASNDDIKLYSVNLNNSISINTDSSLIYDGGSLNGVISNYGNMDVNNITITTRGTAITNNASISKLVKLSDVNININNSNYESGIYNTGNMDINRTNITINNNYGECYGIYNSGKFKFLNGSITASSGNSYGIYNNSNSSDINVLAPRYINISNSNNGYGIYNIKGTINLLSGDIFAYDNINSYGIYQTGGEIIVGSYDGSGLYSADVSTTVPFIKAIGSNSGIGAKRIDGIFRFFDGKIMGSTYAKPEAPSQIEPNYIVQTYNEITTGYEYVILECLSEKSAGDIVDWNVKITENDTIKSRLFTVDNVPWKDASGNPITQLQYGAIGNITIKIDGTSMNTDFKYKITVSMADGSPITVTNNNIEEIMDISEETEKSFTIVLNCSSPTADYTTIDKNIPITITIEKID